MCVCVCMCLCVCVRVRVCTRAHYRNSLPIARDAASCAVDGMYVCASVSVYARARAHVCVRASAHDQYSPPIAHDAASCCAPIPAVVAALPPRYAQAFRQ